MNDRDFDPVLDELSTWAGDAGPLDPAARHRVRNRLLSTMEVRRRPLWERPGPRIAVSGLATAAIAATVLVAVRDDGGTDQGTATAKPTATADTRQPAMRPVSARTVLAGAAAYERKHSQAPATPPRGDQFIYTKEIIKETNQKTGETKTHVDEIWRSVDDSQRSWIMEIGKGWWSDPPKKDESSWPPQDWATLEKLPTDPEKLILSLVPKSGPNDKNDSLAGITDQEWSVVHSDLAGLLKLVPVMPEGLRPAAYEALSRVPGVRTVPDQKDAKGRTGVAITYKDPTLPKGVTSFGGYFIFDPKTYEFLGFKDDRTSGDGAKKKTYIQLSYLDSWAITDKVKQRP
ncbi:CU044_5270 family protein [Streptomyces sp. NPDC057694]|uniref:CU044_5270 family protein n=1 Tax=Streptomyces sp. NPDC057694 TaxID=3346216 RepID=UPI0036A159E5